MKKISRREFCKITAVGTAGLVLGDMLLSEKTALGYVNKDPINPNINNTRVVYIYDTNMTTGSGVINFWNDQNAATVDSVVSDNIDKMAKALAEESNISNAWHKIFLKPASKANWSDVVVAIKTNTIYVQHTRNAVIKKFCEVMVNVMGVTGSNVHIYDACHGADMFTKTPFYNLPSGVVIEGRWGGSNTSIYVPAPYDGNTNCQQQIANGTVDILINIALCKGHDNTFGGLTMCMKNHFGTCDPCSRSYTANYLIGINKTEAILGQMDSGTGHLLFPRQQLCFIDALWASEGGPSVYPSCRPNRFFMGTFPPIVDYLVAKRFRNGTMGWSINNTVVNRFLSDFGYTEGDLTNGAQMIDAATWSPSAVQDWKFFR